MAGFIEILRSGAWVTRARMRLVAGLLIAAGLVGGAYLIGTSDGRNDRFGRPLGTDFSNVYAAGTYVLEGKAAAPFDPVRQYAREQAIFGKDTPIYGWHYPPFFLVLAAFFALMPYGLALALWQGVTLTLYLWAMRAIVFASPSPAAGGIERLWLLVAVAFPAVLINLGHGHNGFLTTALFTAGLVMLVERPVLAGILLGLLAYKPQFGLLIPLARAGGGYWRTFISAAVTVAVLAAAVTFAFGFDVWTAFLGSTHFTRTVILEQGDTGWHKIQSLFALVRMWGGSIPLAYALQTAVTILVAGALIWLWRGPARFALKAAALLIGTVLATPYALDYDLMLLAPAIAFLAVDGLARGFAPYEKTLLALLWLVPLFARSVAEATLIPLAVPLMLAAFVFLLRRAMVENSAAQGGGVLKLQP